MKCRILAGCVVIWVMGILWALFPWDREAGAATTVPGNITSNTVWNTAGSPYRITGDITIINGAGLTIQPGVQVSFDAGTGLTVQGLLRVVGNAVSPVVFASGAGTPQAGDWDGIRFEAESEPATFDGGGNYTGGCTIQYAQIRHAGPGISCILAAPYLAHNLIETNASLDGGGVFVMGDAVLEENTIQNNRALGPWGGGGVYFAATTGTLKGNTISSNYAMANGGGISLQGGIETVQNVISANETGGRGGGIFIGADRPNVQGNTIDNNVAGTDGGGIYCHAPADIKSNVLRNNEASIGGGGVLLATTDITFENNTLSGNSSDLGGGLNFNDRERYPLGIAIPGNTFSNNADFEIFNAAPSRLDARGCRFPGLSGDALAQAIHDHEDDYDVGNVLLPIDGDPIYVSRYGDCGTREPCYDTVSKAVENAASGASIFMSQGTYGGDVTVSNKALTFQGGWDTSFWNRIGTTTLQGAPKTQQGSFTLKDLKIEPK